MRSFLLNNKASRLNPVQFVIGFLLGAILFGVLFSHATILHKGNDDCSAAGAASDCSRQWSGLLLHDKFDDGGLGSEWQINAGSGSIASETSALELYRNTGAGNDIGIDGVSGGGYFLYSMPTGTTRRVIELYVNFVEIFTNGDMFRYGFYCYCGGPEDILFIEIRQTTTTTIRLYGEQGNSPSSYTICTSCAETPASGDIWLLRLSYTRGTSDPDASYYIERNGTQIYSGTWTTPPDLDTTTNRAYIQNAEINGQTNNSTSIYVRDYYEYYETEPIVIYGAATLSSARLVDENDAIVPKNGNSDSCTASSGGVISIDISGINTFRHHGRIKYYTTNNCTGTEADVYPSYGVAHNIFPGDKYKLASSVSQSDYNDLFKELIWGAYTYKTAGWDSYYPNAQGNGTNMYRFAWAIGQWLGAGGSNIIKWNNTDINLTNMLVNVFNSVLSSNTGTSTISKQQTYLGAWFGLRGLWDARDTVYSTLTSTQKSDWTTWINNKINTLTSDAAVNYQLFDMNNKIMMRKLYLYAASERSNPYWLPAWNLNKIYRQVTPSPDTSKDGTLNNFTGSYWLSGCKLSNCLDFAGDNDFVVLDGTHKWASLNEGTVEGWYYQDTISGNQTFFAIGPTSTSIGMFLLLYVDANGAFRILHRNSTADTINAYTANNVITAGNYYHIMWAVDSGGNKLYINGSQQSLTYSAGSASSVDFFNDIGGTHNYYLGARKYNGSIGNYLNGRIDEVAIWDIALSGSTTPTISQRYNSGNGSALNGTEANLVGNWHLNESSGTIAANTTLLGGMTDITSAAQTDDTTYAAIGGLLSTEYLYFVVNVSSGSNVINPIDALKIVMGPTVNTNTATLIAEYCTVNTNINTPCDTWTSIAITDGTSVSGVPFAQSGEIYINNPPSDWIKSVETGSDNYWLRIKPTQTLSTTVDLDEADYRGEHTFDCSAGGYSCELTYLQGAYGGSGFWNDGGSATHYDSYSMTIAIGYMQYLMDGMTHRKSEMQTWMKEHIKSYAGLLDGDGYSVGWGRSTNYDVDNAAYILSMGYNQGLLDDFSLVRRAMDLSLGRLINKNLDHRDAKTFVDLYYDGTGYAQESYVQWDVNAAENTPFGSSPSYWLVCSAGQFKNGAACNSEDFWNQSPGLLRLEVADYAENVGNKMIYRYDKNNQLLLLFNAANQDTATTEFVRQKYSFHFASNLFAQSVGTSSGTTGDPMPYQYATLLDNYPFYSGTTQVGFLGDGLTILMRKYSDNFINTEDIDMVAVAIDNHIIWVSKIVKEYATSRTAYHYSLPIGRRLLSSVTTEADAYGGCQQGYGLTVCLKSLSPTTGLTITPNYRFNTWYRQLNRYNMDSSAVQISTGLKTVGNTYYEIMDMGLKNGAMSLSSHNSFSNIVSSSSDDHQINAGSYRVYIRTGTGRNESIGYGIEDWTIKGGAIRGFAGALSGDAKFGGMGITEIKYLSDVYASCTVDCDMTFDKINTEIGQSSALIKVNNFGTSTSYVMIDSLAFGIGWNLGGLYGKTLKDAWEPITVNGSSCDGNTDAYMYNGDLYVCDKAIERYSYPIAQIRVDAALGGLKDRPFNPFFNPWNQPWTEEDHEKAIHTSYSAIH